MTDSPEDIVNKAADMIADDKVAPLCCPKCGEALPFTLVAKFKERSRVRWRIVPAPGELLSATTVGGSIEAMADLLQSVGEDIGIPTEVLMESCSTDENGVVDVHLLITRFATATKRRERFADKKESER